MTEVVPPRARLENDRSALHEFFQANCCSEDDFPL